MCMGILSACRSVHQVYGVLQRPGGGPASFSVSMRNEWAFLLFCMLSSIADLGHFTRCLCVACFNCISQIAEGILFPICVFIGEMSGHIFYWFLIVLFVGVFFLISALYTLDSSLLHVCPLRFFFFQLVIFHLHPLDVTCRAQVLMLRRWLIHCFFYGLCFWCESQKAIAIPCS